MKKGLLLIIVCIVLGFSGFAQKYACVDTEYILSNIPEYTQAQKTLDELSITWQKEVEAKFQNIDNMYKAYQAEAVLLPEDLKKKKENEIINAEKDAKELQRKYFGNDGSLSKKRQELVKPIQERVYNAIEKKAQEKNYVFVFDKAAGATILYSDAKYDISDEVLGELGYSAKK